MLVSAVVLMDNLSKGSDSEYNFSKMASKLDSRIDGADGDNFSKMVSKLDSRIDGGDGDTNSTLRNMKEAEIKDGEASDKKKDKNAPVKNLRQFAKTCNKT